MSNSDVDAEASSEDEEQQAATPAEQKEEWTSELHAIIEPLSRFRHPHQRYPPSPDLSPIDLLQLFLPIDPMEEFADHTNAATPRDWRPTTAA